MIVQFMGFAEGHTLKGVSEGDDVKTVLERKHLQIVRFMSAILWLGKTFFAIYSSRSLKCMCHFTL